MSGPQPCSLSASPKIKGLLQNLAHSRQKPAGLVRRSQLILAMLDGLNNAQAARQFQLHIDTPRLWRNRWRELYPQLEALEAALRPEDHSRLDVALEGLLTDEPRPGTPPTFTPEQVAAIIALACEDPTLSKHSFEYWTPTDLAREAVKRGLVTSISPASIRLFLKGSRPKTAP